jgi:hypothetical protein
MLAYLEGALCSDAVSSHLLIGSELCVYARGNMNWIQCTLS